MPVQFIELVLIWTLYNICTFTWNLIYFATHVKVISANGLGQMIYQIGSVFMTYLHILRLNVFLPNYGCYLIKFIYLFNLSGVCNKYDLIWSSGSAAISMMYFWFLHKHRHTDMCTLRSNIHLRNKHTHSTHMCLCAGKCVNSGSQERRDESEMQ